MKGITINREKFWGLYKQNRLGTRVGGRTVLTTGTVQSLEYILDRFETEAKFDNIPQFSYFLATVYHETGHPVRLSSGSRVFENFKPVKEGKARRSSRVWIKYQSKYWGTGYYGRGLIQTTHRANYLISGQMIGVGDLFVREPDKMLEIRYSYETAVLGMVQGIYRRDRRGRQTLDRYFPNDTASLTHYANAREIINGDRRKNGVKIGKIAQTFEQMLRACQVFDDPEILEVPIGSDIAEEDLEEVQEAVLDSQEETDSEEFDGFNEEELQEPVNNYPSMDSAPPQQYVSTALAPVEIGTTEKTGFGKKALGIVSGIFTGSYIVPTFIQSFFKDVLSEQQANLIIGALPFLVLTGLVSLLVWYIIKKVNNYKLTELKARINTNPDLRDIKFVKGQHQAPKILSIR